MLCWQWIGLDEKGQLQMELEMTGDWIRFAILVG